MLRFQRSQVPESGPGAPRLWMILPAFLLRDGESDQGGLVDAGAGCGLLSHDGTGPNREPGRRVASSDGRNGDRHHDGRVGLDADAKESRLCSDDGQTDEIGHDEAVGRSVVRDCDQKIDAGLGDALRARRRILREDGAYAGVSLWEGYSKANLHKIAIHDGKLRAEVTASLLKGYSQDFPPLPYIPEDLKKGSVYLK